MGLELTANEKQDVAVDDLVTRTMVWAKKVKLAPSELYKLVGEHLVAGPPLSPEEKAFLKTHGIDEEQFRAVNEKSGGAAYRKLMERRAAKGGAAA